jgi:hypothetical protein
MIRSWRSRFVDERELLSRRLEVIEQRLLILRRAAAIQPGTIDSERAQKPKLVREILDEPH